MKKKVQVLGHHPDKGCKPMEIEVDMLDEALYKLRPKLEGETNRDRVNAVKKARASIEDFMEDKEYDDMQGALAKILINKYKLSPKLAEAVELEAADMYAHPTRAGWCCACDADIAFAVKYLQYEPEFKAEMAKVRLETTYSIIGMLEFEKIPLNKKQLASLKTYQHQLEAQIKGAKS